MNQHDLPPEWRRGTFRVKGGDLKKPTRISGWTRGPFGIAVQDRVAVLSHLATGFRLAVFACPEDAAAAAGAIEGLADWPSLECGEGDGPEWLEEQCRAAFRAIGLAPTFKITMPFVDLWVRETALSASLPTAGA
jgi:hypothetical protein